MSIFNTTLSMVLRFVEEQLTFGGVMKKILYVLAAIGILLFMITIHELGHYATGKLLKFKINEFSIGMGPKLFQRKKKDSDEVFSLRLIPLGGYCAFEGEDAEAGAPNTFNAQAPWKRLIVLFSGAFFNFVSALLIAVIAFSCFGENMLQIDTVYPYSPNYESTYNFDSDTFQSGDVLLSIDGKTIYLVSDYSGLIKDAESTMEVVVFRPYDNTKPVTALKEGVIGERITLHVQKREYTVENDGVDAPYTGWGVSIKGNESRVRIGFFPAIGRSFGYCYEVGTLVLKTLGGLITGSVGLDQVGGPITTIDMTSQIVATGFANILYLITLISVNLAVFNLLPIPALDGCRMVFVLIEWIFKKPINRKVEAIVNLVGILVLFGFVILVDLLKLFG